MPMINLLPWREELRQKRKKEFLLSALGAVLLAGALTMGTKTFYAARISNQDSRNEMLRSEITELDKQIAEIEELDARKRRLIARMEVIEQLERATPETVTLVDSLVNVMPEGTYLTSVAQTDRRVEVAGRVQSSQRVSEFMRNIDKAEWLRNAMLGNIVHQGNGPQREGVFSLLMDQVPISENEEALQ